MRERERERERFATFLSILVSFERVFESYFYSCQDDAKFMHMICRICVRTGVRVYDDDADVYS